MTEVYLVEYCSKGENTDIRVIGIFSTYPKAFKALEDDAQRNMFAELDMSTADMGVFLYCVKGAENNVLGTYDISSYTIDPQG